MMKQIQRNHRIARIDRQILNHQIPGGILLKIKNFILTAAIGGLVSISACADTLNGNGSWQTWSPTVLNTPTTGPYWNGNSGDGPEYNIGWCLTGTGNCKISNPPGALAYYGNGNAAASNVSFTNSGVAQQVSLAGLFSNQNGVRPNGTNYFGWYTDNGGVVTLNPLLNSTEAVGSYATFAPTGTYGFYEENVQSPNTSYTANYFWFTDTSLDYTSGPGAPATDGGQHFSIFGSAGSSTYYLGLEDTPFATSDLDYNDMVIKLEPAPEPSSLMLLAGGVCVLAFGFFFRRHSHQSPNGNN